MKIYVASSWRNPYQPKVIEELRKLGHEVYDFRNPRENDKGFHWSEIDPLWEYWTPEEYVNGLNHPIAENGFKSDFDAMKWADCCVMVLPCGRSANTEAGWMKGAGKQVHVFMPIAQEPELMYKIYDSVLTSFEQLSEISQLKEQIKKEDQPKTAIELVREAFEPIQYDRKNKEDIIQILSSEKIEDIQTFTTTINPDVIPDTCCGKYKEEQPLKSAEEIYKKVYIKSEADLPKDTGKHIVHIPINDEVYSVHLETMITQWKRFDWYLQPIKDITNIPYPNPIYKHQTDINMGWMRAMKYMKNQPVKDITDEEIENKITDLTVKQYGINVKGFYIEQRIIGAK